jgi:hypothetical protein
MLSKLISFFMCLLLAVSPVAAAAAGGDVASVNGVSYPSLQPRSARAQAGESEAERTVVLQKGIDLGEGLAEIAGGNVILDLNGMTLSGGAESVVSLSGTAGLTIRDSGDGTGRLMATEAVGGSAVSLGGADCTLVVEGGTLLAAKPDACAIDCAQRGTCVTVVGGSVRGITCEHGDMDIVNQENEALVCYVLTIGNPPLINTPCVVTPFLRWIIHTSAPARTTKDAYTFGCPPAQPD